MLFKESKQTLDQKQDSSYHLILFIAPQIDFNHDI